MKRNKLETRLSSCPEKLDTADRCLGGGLTWLKVGLGCEMGRFGSENFMFSGTRSHVSLRIAVRERSEMWEAELRRLIAIGKLSRRYSFMACASSLEGLFSNVHPKVILAWTKRPDYHQPHRNTSPIGLISPPNSQTHNPLIPSQGPPMTVLSRHAKCNDIIDSWPRLGLSHTNSVGPDQRPATSGRHWIIRTRSSD